MKINFSCAVGGALGAIGMLMLLGIFRLAYVSHHNDWRWELQTCAEIARGHDTTHGNPYYLLKEINELCGAHK